MNPALAPCPVPDTTAWRIWHDPVSGIWVDHFDGRWLVQTQAASFPEQITERALASGARGLYWRPREAEATAIPQWRWGERVESPFSVLENGARFKIDFSAGYSPGIFLDQRENRLRVRTACRSGQRVLNAFAYTGAFSVMAALAGAETVTLDLSRNYLDWTWENFALNGLDRIQHHGCKGDAFEWLNTFARQGRSFDGVILDPPTFSRHGKKTFLAERDYSRLVSQAAKVAASGGWLLCCANTHRMSIKEFRRQILAGLSEAGRRSKSAEAFPMPPEFNGDDYLKTIWVSL